MQIVILLVVTHHADPVVPFEVIRFQMKCHPLNFPVPSVDDESQWGDLHVSLRRIDHRDCTPNVNERPLHRMLRSCDPYRTRAAARVVNLWGHSLFSPLFSLCVAFIALNLPALFFAPFVLEIVESEANH